MLYRITTLIILSFAFSFTGIGQVNSEVSNLVLEHVNHLRDSLGLNSLQLDAKLIQAADDHSYYQANQLQLTHFQKTFTKETPFERVLYYEGNRTYVAENVAKVPTAINKDTSLNLKLIAKRLYDSWFHSEGHYANMIDANMTLMGLAIGFDGRGSVYGTQVFSSDEIRLPIAFRDPEMAWGVRPGEFNCKDDAKQYETMFFANHVAVEGNSIYMVFHDMNFFRGVISGENDGFAIDVVLREQLPCSKENQFHASEVYDGEMQRPIYRNDLLRNDLFSNPKKIKVKIGEVPSYLRGRQWDANVIVINDNILCDYSVPVAVPSDIYPLLDLEPFYVVDTLLSFEPVSIHIKDSVHLRLKYERSAERFIPDSDENFRRFSNWGGYASNVQVECFASVEGKKWYNNRLLKERELRAREVLYNLGMEESVAIAGKENWEMMKEQIERHNLSEFKGRQEEQVKYLLKRNPSAFYDSLLFEQRVNHIYANIDTVVEVSDYYSYWLASQYDSTISINALPWNKILLEDHIQLENPIFSSIFDSIYADKRYKTNLLNAGAIDYANARLDSTKVETFVKGVDVTDSRQLFNYAHFLTTYWFKKYTQSYEFIGIAQTIEPERLRELVANLDTNLVSEEQRQRLDVNILVSGIHYYVTHNKWGLQNTYFDAIADLVKLNYFTPEEAMGLALFCNYFHKFDQAVQILAPFHDEKTLTEDGYFVLAQTSSLISQKLELEKYHEYMESAKRVNKSRYCKWLDDEFQIQRDEYLKKDFCTTCP